MFTIAQDVIVRTLTRQVPAKFEKNLGGGWAIVRVTQDAGSYIAGEVVLAPMRQIEEATA
jgi:hypothetical protein